jgi:hypothetical protein
MLVPENAAHPSPGVAETIPTPGAATSGFRRSETAVGPTEENSAWTLADRVSSTAPTVIAREEFPGDETDPAPTSL